MWLHVHLFLSYSEHVRTIEVTGYTFFPLQGINAKFTQKLYEWEERRGIAPESSTLALLNENFGLQDNGTTEADKKGNADKGEAACFRRPPVQYIIILQNFAVQKTIPDSIQV